MGHHTLLVAHDEVPSGVAFTPVVRQVVRFTGKTFISLGVLILLFVGYQLWGTGIAQGRDQKALRSELVRQLPAPAATTPPGSGVIAPPAPARQLGDAVALIQIPKIGVDQAVVEGVGVEDLKKGPGHYPGTILPGQAGNAAIAGHRTTYGAPFFRLDELAPGDPITVTTGAGRFRYEVTKSQVVAPGAIEVLDPTPDSRLTLTTCTPRFSAAQRLIVVSRLIGPAAAPEASPPAANRPRIDLEPPAFNPNGPANTSLGDGQSRAGLSGMAAAKRPAAISGGFAALVWLITWLAARAWRRGWLAYLIGAPVFAVVLFVFFENVALLLPANI